MEKWNEVLVSIVKERCSDKEWSKERIARECRIHSRQLYRYLKGERIPSADVFFRIIKCCDYSATFEIPVEKIRI
jgi:transcriptional regulator with XRE-family HTH domain